MADKLSKIKKIDRNSSILVVGLGNWNITPDALGPKVIDKVLVTRHLIQQLPQEIDESVRMVSAIATGVMGLTGMETGEVVKGIVENIKPDLVIAIDALAARKISRINTTIQMSDTGISPGSGVGNTRMALNEQTLGVPVIAIGVPTVVDAATMVNDTMDKILEQMEIQADKGTEFYKMLRSINEEEKYHLILEVLEPYTGNMFVTPKEVDAVVDRLADIIGNAINVAVHPGIDTKDVNKYIYA
jgi:spore protease